MKKNINLFIVGAVKCGTTSLYNYLSQHREVFPPKVKELNHYSSVESIIKEHYKNPIKNKFYQYKIVRFPVIYFSLFVNSEAYKVIGDSSTSSLWDKESAGRQIVPS